MDPTETAHSVIDFITAGLRTARELGAPDEAVRAAVEIESARGHIVEVAETIERGVDGKVDPVKISNTVVDVAKDIAGALPGGQVAVGIIAALAGPLRMLAFEASKVSLHGTGDVAVTADLRRAG